MELWQIAELMIGQSEVGPAAPAFQEQSSRDLIRARYEAAQNGEPEPEASPMSDDAVGIMSAAFAMPRGE